MFTTKLRHLTGTEREVKCPKGGFTSFRYLLAEDGMGFSVCRTVIPAGEPQHWHYKNHLEACLCLEGSGTLTNLRTGQKFRILPDTMYVLDQNDDHQFQAGEKIVLISIFNPPLTGAEVHDENHSYPVPEAV